MNSYRSIAMGEQIPGKRISGTLRINESGVSFDSDFFKELMPLDKLKIWKGGASNNFIFFSHPDLDCTFYTENKTILSESVLNSRKEIALQILKIRKKSRSAVLAGFLAAAAVIAVLYFSVIGILLIKERAIDAIVKNMPVSWEERLGDLVYSQFEGQVIKNQSLSEDLNVVTMPLIKAAQKNNARNYKFSFSVVNESSINAFALPGGRIVIHSALINKTNSAEELAGVLAHELAHITEQHSLRQMIQSMGVFLLLQAVIGDAEGIMGVILENSGYLLTLKFSRDFETDADRIGFQYLEDAHINPSGMKDFFRKLASMESHEENKTEEDMKTGKDNASDVFEALSTHPDTEKRIQNIEKMLIQAKSENYRKLNLDYTRFKSRIVNLTD